MVNYGPAMIWEAPNNKDVGWFKVQVVKPRVHIPEELLGFLLAWELGTFFWFAMRPLLIMGVKHVQIPIKMLVTQSHPEQDSINVCLLSLDSMELMEINM